MKLVIFSLCLSVPTLVLAIHTLLHHSPSFLAAQIIFAVCLGIAGWATRISLGRRRIQFDCSKAFTPFWIFLWGPAGAIAVLLYIVPSMAYLRRWIALPPAASSAFLACWLGGVAYQALGGPLGPKAVTGQVLLAMTAAFLLMVGLEFLCIIVYLALREGTSLLKTSATAHYITPSLLLFPLNVLMVLIWTNWGIFHLLLLLLPFSITLWVLKIALQSSSERQDLNSLYTFGEALQPLVEQDEVFGCLAETASNSEIPKSLLIARLDTEKMCLIPTETRGLFATEGQGEIPLAPELKKTVADEGKICTIQNLLGHPLRPSISDKIQSLVIVPLISGTRVEGAIVSGHEMPDFFHEEHVRFLSLLANQVTFTFARVELYRRLVQSSLTDETTGLYNRRHFLKALDAEIRRSDRYGPPFSLLAFDIDNFKKINDTFGHPQGDQVLKDLAETARRCIRDGVDIIARTGGEEFHIILPATHCDQGRIVGERLRRRIEEHPFSGDLNPLTVTVSIGLVSYPLHSEDATGLLQEVDDALYQAKRSGKNQLCVREIASPPQPIWNKPKGAPPNLSIKDEATGLFTQEFFAFRLREELCRSDRYEAPCSLIIVRSAQDGAIPSDRLKAIVTCVQRSVRLGIDIPSLFQGGELAILLPETSDEHVGSVADRLCRGLSARPAPECADFVYGFATYPKDALTEEELFSKARKQFMNKS
ncbi:MAG: diguanylate cyclase [Armatimonadetes bacterium]|nr:diguanylate cyclase [Armatimonadota bacterium]